MASPQMSSWGGTRQNVALAECARCEELDGDLIVAHFSGLHGSPMYRLLVEKLKAELADERRTFEPDWYLGFFAARLFYAGVIAGRQEKGERDRFGDLILDSCQGDARRVADSLLHPA